MKISQFSVCLWMIDKSFSSSTYYQEMVINDLQLSDQVEEIKSVEAAIAILDEDMGSLDQIPWHTHVCGEDASVPLPRSREYVIALEQMLLGAISLGKRSISGSPDELCLVMGHLDVKRFQSGKQVLGKLWRNQLAEHFVKYGKQYGIFVGHDSASLSRDATLKTLEDKLDASYEAFLLFYAHKMPGTVYDAFKTFVEDASTSFEFNNVLAQWIRENPLHRGPKGFVIESKLKPKKCLVGMMNPPKLPTCHVCETIRELAKESHTWNELEQETFCSIAVHFEEGKNEPDFTASNLGRLDRLIQTRKAIENLCRYTFSLDIESVRNLDELNKLVVEAARIPRHENICGFITQWKEGRLHEDELVETIRLAVKPSVALSPAQRYLGLIGRRLFGHGPQ